MPDFSEASILAFFSEYANQPGYVYSLIIAFMLASSFGFPVPEELVLITAGLIAYMAKESADGVNTTTLAIVCFFAVFFSDLLVFLIGKFFGGRLVKSKFFQRKIEGKVFNRINHWFQKYGSWACGIFRFTPGLRFPGHLSCGLMGIPVWKFALIDGLAALVSVPTQIYLVSAYGDVVLEKIKEFKIFVFFVLLAMLIVYLIKKVRIRFDDVRKRPDK